MNYIKQLMKHDSDYTDGKPTLSDREYDILKNHTKQQYPNHPYFNAVGAPVKGVKTKLPVVMGSLNKVKSSDGSYVSWCKDNPGKKVYWAKMDGLSLYTKYIDGKLVQSITRGNGEYGQDVTQKSMLFCPLELNNNFTGEIRSEVMLEGNNYAEFGYTTRRNGAAGLINQDSIENVKELICRSYELISDSKGVPTTELERIQRLTQIGVELAPNMSYDNDLSDDEISDVLTVFKSMGYDVDGVVVVLNDSEREDTKYPDLKVAWKGLDETVQCEVTRVEWSVGRTSKVTPVVNIIPTVIGGVTVEKATGFNAKFIQDNRIEKGTIVNIKRSGSVIPYIESVETV